MTAAGPGRKPACADEGRRRRIVCASCGKSRDRATEPTDLWKTADPVGPDNDRHIAAAVAGVEVVAAWGANARPARVAEVLALIGRVPGAGRVHALGTTKTGQPRHPLYLRGDCVMRRWEAAGDA